jgi:hypothetical protein
VLLRVLLLPEAQGCSRAPIHKVIRLGGPAAWVGLSGTAVDEEDLDEVAGTG